MANELTTRITKEAESKKKLSIKDLIEESADKLGQALPSHMRPERIIRIAMTTLRMNPALYKCDPMSFLGALFQSAQLGLEPNIEGQAYIIPYKIRDKKTNQYVDVAQFQIGYKGYVELFWRHQSSISIQMEMIHDADHFKFDVGNNLIEHTWDLRNSDRGPVIGYYAIAGLQYGGKAIKVITRQDALDHGKRFSKCWDKNKQEFKYGTPWREHFDAMAMKTILIKLMKILPKSIEIQRAISMDETVKYGAGKDMFEVPNIDDFDPEEAGPGPKAVAQLEGEPQSNADEATGNGK